MRYELLIRPLDPTGRFTSEAVGSALEMAQLPGPGLPAELDLGSGKVMLEGWVREGRAEDDQGSGWDGLNFSFPMALQANEGDRAVGMAFELAQALGAQVYDPQVGELVKASDHDRVLATWRRSWAFQADIVGATDLGYGDPGLPEPQRGFLSGRTGLALTIIFALLVLVYLVRSCSGSEEGPRPPRPHPPVQSDAGE